MRDEWDNSRAPQLGDRRVSPGCGCLFIVMFFTVIALAMGLVQWAGQWIGGIN